MGIFKFFSNRIPSKPRNKDLQTNGSVSVNVQKNVGMRTENASTVVNNISVTDNYKGRITISDLLLIPSSSVGANDLYLVYSSGSDEAGWSQGGEFTYEGETYSDGTFMQWMIDRWVAVDRDQQEEKQPTLFNPLQKIVSLITKTFAQSSYYNLPGRYKAGIPIAEVRKYELDEAGVYQEKTESQSGTYAAETSVMTLVVPYAHSYVQGGETVYEGGALTAADYMKLCTGGGGQPQPSGGNVDDVQVNGASVVEDRVANIDLAAYLNPYATQSWVSSQGFLKSVPSSYATQSWVQSQDYAIDKTHKWYTNTTRVTAKLFSFRVAKGSWANGTVEMSYASRISGVGSFRFRYADNNSDALKVDTYYTINAQAADYLVPALYVTSDASSWIVTCYAVIENYSHLTMQELAVYTTVPLTWNTDQYPANVTAEGTKVEQTFNAVPIDTTAPETPSDDHVPSTKLFADNMKFIGELFNGLADSKADKSMLNKYYNKTEIDENFYNKAYLNVVLRAVATKSDIEGMCKRIVVTSSKTFTVEELTGVAEILVKPSANMQVILPNDAVAIAGDRITISVIPANNTAGVDISTQTTTLFHNSSGYIATMSVTYIGSGWRLWGVQSTSM